MNALERRQTEMLVRVDNFGKENAADFPAGSAGAQAFAAISQAVAELTQLGGDAVAAEDARLSSTARRSMAREEIYKDLLAISQTARALALDNEVFTDRFRIPRKNLNDETLLQAARAFAADAAPLKNDFIAYGLPADFLTDLNADIEKFEQITDDQDESNRERISANAEIDAIIEQAMIARRKLDVIVPNVFRGNAGKLADWASASHVERAPQKQAPTPPQPTA